MNCGTSIEGDTTQQEKRSESLIHSTWVNLKNTMLIGDTKAYILHNLNYIKF